MKHWTRILTLVALGLILFAGQSQAKTSWGSPTDPGNTPPNGGAPWVKLPQGQYPVPTTVGSCVWIGAMNSHRAANTKSYTLTLNMPPGTANKYTATATGYTGGVGAAGTANQAVNGNTLTITGKLTPQPAWEVIKLCRTAKFAGPLKTSMATDISFTSICSKTVATANYVDFLNAAIGIIEETQAHFTEVWVFADNSGPAALDMQQFVPPPDSGPWSSQVVFNDPYGEPRPLGGVRWQSDGEGLGAEEIYYMHYVMEDLASEHYTIYALDADDGEYRYYSVEAEMNYSDDGDKGYTVEAELE